LSETFPWLDSLFWLSLVPIFLYLASLIALADRLGKSTARNGELTRKILHIGAGNVILLAWWLQIPAAVILCAAILAGSIAIASYYLPILPSINSVGRRSWGTFFYAVSIGLLVGYFWPLQQPLYAAIGILIMCWGDGLAALVGQNFGKHPYQIWGMHKSWEGSLTMVGVSFLVTYLLLLAVGGDGWTVLAISLVVGSAAAILEAFSKWGIDNLLVPLGSAALAFALNSAFS
jgi:phytol kinase